MGNEPETESPFVVGANVALVTRFRWTDRLSFEKVKIAKVYKNGNFVLEGDARQWRPDYSTLQCEWMARKTGNGYDYHTVETITPKLIEEAQKTKLQARFSKAIDAISKHQQYFVPTEELVSQLEAIVVLAKPESKP